ncbi:MAG: phenylpyruvate tautomerase MIF-related protein [Gammaproteobacteria bacterium]|nr:phenylpyruvate tautomerase MIF-related protein [Gammaproteobacteria bacterium]
MPCLIIKTNQSLNEQAKTNCCISVSAKTAQLLGKPESYVMTLLEDQVIMTMSGSTEATAYVELKSINLPEDQTSEISNSLCQHIAHLLEVKTNRIYIEFSNAQRHLWGWDGRTF